MLPRHWLLPALIFLLVVSALHRLTFAAGLPEGMPESPLEIVTRGGAEHAFVVLEARSPEQRARGLMFVTELDPREGMLFDSGGIAMASMWMRNTPLPLDMLFIRSDGTISSIARETKPFSRTPVVSTEPVRAVLELLGGTCDRLGIEPGDRVRHRLFPAARHVPPAARTD
jgi:uncharacterized membrane protein (UPF0127 family)